MGFVRSSVLAILATVAAQDVARAADQPFGLIASPAPAARKFEIRLGVYGHDPLSPEKGGADINAEFLYDPFTRDRETRWSLLAPRLHVGGTASFGGKTSQAYTGLTWRWDVAPSVFIEGGFGAALHNGKTALQIAPNFNAMGCGWGFHEQASLGYRLSEAWSVMLTVEHTSNAGLCKQNRGLTNAGVRLGYSF